MINLVSLKLKNLLDLFISFFLIVFSSPILIICFLIILIQDGYNPIFVQKRIGFNGKTFRMYKFRTMTPNSEHSGSGYYCFEGDTRITKIGKYIRKYSIDELPQLFNVLKGDMSLVGPRPAICDELEKENIKEINIQKINLRTTVKPGISGYAQVYSRNSIDWNTKLEMDCHYLSFPPYKRIFIDLKIICLTFLEIIISKGVYDTKRAR